MAEFSFNVDTSPMARSMDRVNDNVHIVGTAVTAMQAAVIASEQRAASKICESVDNGFFMLLRSKLSQRIAQFASIMNSRVGSMTETASSIDNTHRQMQGDFNRIKARYLKLFSNLDRNLEQRVRELDRPAMDVAHYRSICLGEKQCRSIPAAMYYLTDGSSVSLRLSNARIKARAQDSIDVLYSGTSQIMQYDRSTRSVFEKNVAPAESLEYVPVVYTVAESMVSPNSFSLQVQPPEVLSPETQATIAMGVRRGQAHLLGSSTSDIDAVRAEFSARVAKDVRDQRVKEAMIGLFNTSLYSHATFGAAENAMNSGTRGGAR